MAQVTPARDVQDPDADLVQRAASRGHVTNGLAQGHSRSGKTITTSSALGCGRSSMAEPRFVIPMVPVRLRPVTPKRIGKHISLSSRCLVRLAGLGHDAFNVGARVRILYETPFVPPPIRMGACHENTQTGNLQTEEPSCRPCHATQSRESSTQ